MPPKSVGLLLALITPAPVPGQEAPLVIAPASISLSLTSPRTDSMRIVLVRDGVERSGGWFITTLAQGHVDGRPSYLAIAHDVSPDDLHTHDTLAVDAATLAPRWHRTHAPRDSAAVRYDGRSASGYIAHEGRGRTAIDATLSDHAVEGALVSWVIAALPLQPGYEARIVSFGMWGPGEDTATVRVTGVDSLVLRDGRVEPAWVIETRTGPQDRAIHRQWIDQRTRRVLRTFDAPPRAAHAEDGYWKISTLLRP